MNILAQKQLSLLNSPARCVQIGTTFYSIWFLRRRDPSRRRPTTVILEQSEESRGATCSRMTQRVYDALAIGIFAAFNIFSMKMP